MQQVRFSIWQRSYRAALSEPDIRKLAARVDAAEQAIFCRLQSLPSLLASRNEIHAIVAALTNLLMLRRATQNAAHWKSDSVEASEQLPYQPN